jgi:hypothetical protein
MTRTQYTIKALCKACFGRGYIWRQSQRIECATCAGTGEVDRTVNEVHSDDYRVGPIEALTDDYAETMLRFAGSLISGVMEP